MSWLLKIYSYLKTIFISEDVNYPIYQNDYRCKSLTLKKIRCKNKVCYGKSKYYCGIHHKLLQRKVTKLLNNYVCKDIAKMICAKML